MASFSEPEILDSLPYYDNEVDISPELRARAEKEWRKAVKYPAEPHPKVPPPFEPFANRPLLAAEMARVEAREPLTALDNIRYQIPTPATNASDDEWIAAVKNAYAQLEHQRLRQINLTLLQTYGSNTWRVHNYLQEATTKIAENALAEERERTVEINRERKNFQTTVGNQLNTLETRWTELISSILQIEMANIALDGEIEQLNKKEAELADALRP